MSNRYPLEIYNNLNVCNGLELVSSLKILKSEINILYELSNLYRFNINVINDENKSYLFVGTSNTTDNASNNNVNAIIIRKYIENGENICDYTVINMNHSSKPCPNISVIDKLIELGFVGKVNGEFYSQ